MRKKTSPPRESRKTAPVSAASARSAQALGLVVAVELGAEFPTLPLLEGTPRRVLTQLEGESPAAFAERVASSLEGAFARGVALGQLSVACNERIDDAAQGARRTLATAALGAMAKQHTGKVTLCATARSSGRLRQALSTLSRGLFDEWRTAGLEASVDFGAEAPAAAATGAFVFTARVA
ncbi:MAG: hypothetical protein EOO73_30470 [Myxococcales bacterium]|nr:MAG: hypothetical protein EOO73_30470 [Myxococcales bacterium]